MAIVRINQDTCYGCRNCVMSCPADVIAFNDAEKKAFVKYKSECIVCCWCIIECPTDSVLMEADRQGPYITTWG